jgi:hypothetical protein
MTAPHAPPRRGGVPERALLAAGGAGSLMAWDNRDVDLVDLTDRMRAALRDVGDGDAVAYLQWLQDVAGAAIGWICSDDGEDAGDAAPLLELRALAQQQGGDVGGQWCTLPAGVCPHRHDHADQPERPGAAAKPMTEVRHP